MGAEDALRYLDFNNLLKPNTIIEGKIVQEALPMIQLPANMKQSETSFTKYCLLRHAIELFSDVHTSGSAIDDHHISKIENGYPAYSAIAILSKDKPNRHSARCPI